MNPLVTALADFAAESYSLTMSSAAQELIGIVDGLPEDKAREVVDFARFLQQQSGDREWERIIAERRTYPKLEQFAAAALREGAAEPLDPSKL
jgi:hypothetical protein